jgi:non-specific serine/threonine protein kinase
VGGFGQGAQPSAEVTRYDTRRRRWSLVSPLPTTLNHAAVVGHRGRLYVLGGYTNAPLSPGPVFDGLADVSRAFFVYRPERDEWQRLPDLPRRRAAGAVAVIHNRLYLAGGVGPAYRGLAEVDVFNLRTSRWSRAPDLPLPADHVAGTAARGAFYVLGGRPVYGGENYSYTQRYRPGEKRWRRLADMTRGHAGFGAVTVCGRVVAVGGEQPGDGPSGTIARTEQYDPHDRRWRRLPDLSSPRHGLGVARVGRHIYAIEGGTVTLVGISDVVESLEVDCRERGRPDRRGPRRRP